MSKVDFIIRSFIKKKDVCFQMIKWSIKSEDQELINLYVSKIIQH